MRYLTFLPGRVAAFAVATAFATLLAGCVEDGGGSGGEDFSNRAYQPLAPQMLALMEEKGTTKEAPVLIRAYKKEAEFEVWKMRADGRYALLKTYPICRWAGQLGPKTREGDMQVPEGFYSIAPAQMNPNSLYYLSFNVGYPNTYDRAHGSTGRSIMVHGACSSAGCFSMTDKQIAEIYAIAREALAAGEPAIQMQSYPFHMTPENMAKYRLDPNIDFWKELKVGSDNFEVTRHEVAVNVCGGHYVFNAQSADGQPFDPTGACPPLKRDEMVRDEVLAKEKRDDAKVAELVATGVPAIHTVYVDGGQNPSFASKFPDVSDPQALAAGPTDVAMNGKTPTLAQLKAAKAKDLADAAAAEKKARALRIARGEPDIGSAEAYAETPAPTNPAPAQPAQTASEGLLNNFFAHAPKPASTPPAQTAAQQPASGSAATATSTGFSQFYSGTSPQQSATAAPAPTQAADASANAPTPPLRKQTSTLDPSAETDGSNGSSGESSIPEGFAAPGSSGGH